ncbi:MAG: membrane protein insertase YidC [Deltaproteobacteria bacterium]|nr:membrane protein insertase YidC [Deltaproteobacteria bacterium]
MDWKIIVVIVVGLSLFFFVRQCSRDDAPKYDKIQAQERAERAASLDQKKINEAEEARRELEEGARAARGTRPAEETATLETADFKATFTTRGGSLRSFTLKDPQYREPPRNWADGTRNEKAETYVPVNLVTTNPDVWDINNPLRFEVYEGLPGLLPEADYRVVDGATDRVVFEYDQPGFPIVITKKFEVDKKSGPYQIWLTVQVRNRGPSRHRFRAAVVQQGYQHASETSGGMFSKPPNLQQAICRYGGATFRSTIEKLETPFSGMGVSFAGVETNYFLAAMIPGDATPTTCFAYATPQQVIRTELRFGEVELEPGAAKIFKIKNYLGPKRFRVLRAAGHELTEAVDFGWLWPICQFLLALLLAFQSWFVNWGVAIILLTVVVKVVLTPLTHRSFVSAERMRQLKPQVDELNVKYKDDAQAKQKAMMDLYKQNGVNPLGGCLPTLLQMPIWIALYTTLRTSPELYRAPFFGWIRDLASPDPYFVTPIVMGGLMFVQQRITPMAGDSMQNKMMMYFMPIMFTAMMLFLPSGLTLYILVSTVLSILHQYYIHRRSPRTAMAAPRAARKG